MLALAAMPETPRSQGLTLPSLDEALALPRVLEAAVEPRFIDSMGHMNVSWYVHLFDRATWAFFATVGIDAAYRERANAGMFAVEQHIRYLSELREGEPLAVHARLIALSAKSLRLRLAMIDTSRRQLSAAAEVVGVHIDMGSRRASPFPDEIAARLRAALVPDPAAA
jgi:acyl-CoA thioester hydrolase